MLLLCSISIIFKYINVINISNTRHLILFNSLIGLLIVYFYYNIILYFFFVIAKVKFNLIPLGIHYNNIIFSFLVF